jgi:hypothetical protein
MAMATEPARLTITRTSDRDARERQVYASLDDAQIAYLMFGEQVTRDIAPGRHVLKVNNTLVWKTVAFDIAPGEHVRFSVANYQGRGFATLLAVFGVGLLFLSIDREP